MKKLAIILGILFIASLSLQAQKREERTTTAKSYKKDEKSEKKAENKSEKNYKPTVKIENRKTINLNTVRSAEKRNTNLNVQRPNNQSKVNRNLNVRPNIQRIGNVDNSNRRIIRTDRRPLSVVRTPNVNNIRIRHGYIDNSNRRYGYLSHHIMNFPMRVRYPFYNNYQLLLMHSYQPQIEYPWAIYESENGDNTASIEGEVIDIEYNRRTNQYILQFGRKSPYQSATVIIPDYLSRQLNYRDLRKLKRDYVSVYGRFTNYGNVPTIILNSFDEFYVNDMTFADFIYNN
ncbi:MAG: DUF2681 domain-containing protein [Bacteroidetes bacterium]|nr:DUF2681 domain-containing protein [Bacteroidota bacterium]